MEPSSAVAKGGQHKTDRPTRTRSGEAVHRAQSILETNAVVPEGTSSARQLKRDAAYRRSLAVSDLLAVALATAVALAPGNTDSGLAVFAALPVVILVSKAVGLYDRDGSVLHKTTLDEVPKLFQVSTMYALAASIATPFLSGSPIAPGQVALLWTLLFFSMLGARALVRAVIKRTAAPER